MPGGDTSALQNQETPEETEFAELREPGVPTVEIKMRQPADFAAEIFKWEVATALACASMGLNPFQEGATQGNIGVPDAGVWKTSPKSDTL